MGFNFFNSLSDKEIRYRLSLSIRNHSHFFTVYHAAEKEARKIQLNINGTVHKLKKAVEINPKKALQLT